MITKKYYFIFLLISCSQQLFTMLPVSQFALIRSKLAQIALQHSCPRSTKLQIREELQACQDKKEVVLLLTRMMAKHDPHDENLLNLKMVEELAPNKMLTNDQILFFIKKGMAMDPLYNRQLSCAAIDLLVKLGKNNILMGRDIVPLLQESIDICGIDDQHVTRVTGLVEAHVLTDVDKENIVSFLKATTASVKEMDKNSQVKFRNDLLGLMETLQKNNILTNNERDSLSRENEL